MQRIHKPQVILLLLSAALWMASPALSLAQERSLEIIALKHRPAAEVIPLVEPFLNDGDVVRGHGFQLFVRTTPDGLKRVRRILERLDRAPRQLLITVRQSRHSERGERGASASGSISSRGSHGRVEVYGTDSREAGGATQQIQVLEGNPAFIQFGQAVPLPQRNVTTGPGGTHIQDSVRYRNVTSGFYVIPQVREDRVTLFIAPQRNTLGREGGGRINLQQAQTTVSGPLGQWLTVGGTVERSGSNAHGSVYSTRERTQQQGRIQLKVVEIGQR